jgi:hypothetical protein
MNMRLTDHGRRRELSAFTRTRFFHGQLLEAHHLEDEQRYLNGKRCLLNRLVTGYGVVAGLNVEVDPSGSRLIVGPGLALDRAGREIVVPRATLSEVVAPRPNGPDDKPRPNEHCHDDEDWVHVVICFHECPAEPERSFVGACDCETECEHGAVHERFEIRIEEGRAKGPNLECTIRSAILGGRIRYDELVAWVTTRWLEIPRDPCITLANVLRPAEGGRIDNDSIDINVRPIVYGNDLLFELICGLISEEQSRQRGSK